MRALLCILLLAFAACSSVPAVPEKSFQDFIPLEGELPQNVTFTRINETFRSVNYTRNPGFILPEHYDQLYLHPDMKLIDQVMYIYLTPNGTFVPGGELGIFVMRFVNNSAADVELDKVKDYVYFKDLRNFYIGRSGRYILEYWSDDPGDARMRGMFFSMQKRLGFEEIQPIG